MNGFKVSQMMSMNIQGPGSAANRLTSGNSNTQNSKFAQMLDARSSDLTTGSATSAKAVSASSSSAASGSSSTSTASSTNGANAANGTPASTDADQPDDITMQRMMLVQQNMTQQPAQVEIDQDDDPPPAEG